MDQNGSDNLFNLSFVLKTSVTHIFADYFCNKLAKIEKLLWLNRKIIKKNVNFDVPNLTTYTALHNKPKSKHSI